MTRNEFQTWAVQARNRLTAMKRGLSLLADVEKARKNAQEPKLAKLRGNEEGIQGRIGSLNVALEQARKANNAAGVRGLEEEIASVRGILAHTRAKVQDILDAEQVHQANFQEKTDSLEGMWTALNRADDALAQGNLAEVQGIRDRIDGDIDVLAVKLREVRDSLKMVGGELQTMLSLSGLFELDF